jgi:hypothetical protein
MFMLRDSSREDVRSIHYAAGFGANRPRPSFKDSPMLMVDTDTDFELESSRAPTAVCLAAFRHRVVKRREEALASLTEGYDRRPFLIVTPRGMADLDLLRERLADLGVEPTSRETIEDFASLSTILSGRLADDLSLMKAYGSEAAWNGLFETTIAERWDLATERDLNIVLANESEFRELVPSLYGQVMWKDTRVTVGLHAVYVPRPETWALESVAIEQMTAAAGLAVAV